ncbi:hypothetical protein BJX63DRAFT_432554 [Aspergillus granulosus]|uniref:Uncharacterized protein n=1 Tax=Aspergillus granulosus TaxID=176169 RepID=A0ABR4HAG3_9EURO
MNPSTRPALAALSSLPSAQKTALMGQIAHEITSTIITISREIQRGTLDANHTAPFHTFIRTVQQVEAAQQRKLERKLARYQRRARRWRAERRWIRGEFAEIVRGMERLQRQWKARIEQLEQRRSLPELQMHRTRLGQEPGQELEQGSRTGLESESGGLGVAAGGESVSGV